MELGFVTFEIPHKHHGQMTTKQPKSQHKIGLVSTLIPLCKHVRIELNSLPASSRHS